VTLTKEDRIMDILISGTIHASPPRPTSPIHEIEKALRDQPISEKLFQSKIEDYIVKFFQIVLFQYYF